ncbi:MAG: 2-C-methyl-D-erythritol 2,4-cyclodiphosphate synthase [Sedimentisphaerales bacterium]|nr:2-C-methyl-D-erythritol 2,4-cyclodiphosphate synthase [Sedimentisphaerales bacterium]
MHRVGSGYDLHRLEPDRKLIMAGIEIPFELGLYGHSDADVVVHAVIDALLGGSGLEDIGELFPDTDPKYKGADSCKLLAEVMLKVGEKGFAPVNLDVTIITEKPKLKDYKPIMRKNLASMLGLDIDSVCVKAKTNEKLGPIGEGKAIAALATVGLTFVGR